MKREEIARCVLALLVLAGTVCLSQDTEDADAAAAEEAAAMEEESDSVVTFDYGLGLLGSYHSNPYYRGSGKESDAYVWSADPFLRFDAPVNEMLYLGADLRGKVTSVVFDDEGEDDKTIAHPYLQGKIRYNLSEYTSLSLADDYQTANVDDVGDSPRFKINNASLGFGHAFTEALQTRLAYRNTVVGQTGHSVLFDSMEHAVDGDFDWVVWRTDAGRDMKFGVNGRYSKKDFDDGDFLFQGTRENPKTHDSYRLGGAMTYPLSNLMTVRARAGWVRREYEASAFVRDSETDSPYGGLTLTHTVSPGSPLSFTLASSYDLSDTVVYNIEEQDRAVFETTDALLNNLNISYRELQVLRAGLAADYTLKRLVLGLSASYQRQTADANEDLAPISGNLDPAGTGVGEATERQQYTVTGTVRYQVTSIFSVGLGFQYGVATDRENTDDKDLYDYNSVALLTKLDL
jgi:hypothetical protein